MTYATTLVVIGKIDMREETDITNGDKALIAFRPSHGTTEYQVVLDKGADTIWATEAQIADIFGRDRTVVNRHIKNAFKEGELDEDATSAKIAQVRTEGDTLKRIIHRSQRTSCIITRIVLLFTLALVLLGCSTTSKYQEVELVSRTIYDKEGETRIVFLFTSESNGTVNHEYYFDYPDTTNKYHFVIALDSAKQLSYFGERLAVIRIDTLVIEGVEHSVYRYRYDLEDTYDEETDIYISNGRMILEHNTAWSTLDIYNYDSTTRVLNDQIVNGL